MAEDPEVAAARKKHVHSHRSLDAEHEDDSVVWPAWQAAATDYWVAKHPELKTWLRRERKGPPDIREMLALADLIEHAMDDVPPRWRVDWDSPNRDEHAARVGWWHELMSRMYEPVDVAIDQSARGDQSGVETLVRFLEADVYCHRSGYYKGYAIRALTRLPLGTEIRSRLLRVVQRAVEGPDRREFRAYIRLARFLDGPDLRETLEFQHASRDRRTARHAKWMLAGIAGSGAPRPAATLAALFRNRRTRT